VDKLVVSCKQDSAS
jgi:hypothetical protein